MSAETPSRSFELKLLRARFAVCRLASDTPIPLWAQDGELISITRTADELSIVAEEDRVPPEVKSQGGWRVFQVRGPFAFSEIGVLASLVGPLAVEKISVFAVSTFDTDYLFVFEEHLAATAAALERSGHTIHRSES